MDTFRDYLITDRTQADVVARNERGTYNAADLNRVGRACAYVARRLGEYGYGIPPKVPGFLIATGVSPPGSGVSVGGLYYQGEVVEVYAEPIGESVFLCWMDGEEIVSEDPRYTFTAESDRELTAAFDAEWVRASSIVGSGRIGKAILGRRAE